MTDTTQLKTSDDTETTPAPAGTLPPAEGQGGFTSTRAERLCALLSYITAYLYVNAITNNFRGRINWLILLTCGGIIAITELLNRERRPCRESFVWLGCFVVCTVRICFNWFFGTVWDEAEVYLFTHIFCVWWVLSRSGKLLEGKSGHLLPLDAVNGFIRFPFGSFFLRLKTVGTLSSERKNGRGKDRKGIWWTVLAAVLCVVLFFLATELLTDADEGFAGLLDGFWKTLDIDFGDFWFYFFFSLPVGCWLFGLMAGSARCGGETLERQRLGLYGFLERIRRVPAGLWIAVTGLFSALYLAFFILQGSYLFGAFTRTLPEGFVVAEYARRGFFELCKVIAVNFSVLWLVTRMADEKARENRFFLAICLVFLAESMLFAVIAFSKLALYISCFGYTPLRVQSTWLVCVLFAGCVLWTVNLLTGRKLFRLWMLLGAVSLTVLVLV